MNKTSMLTLILVAICVLAVVIALIIGITSGVKPGNLDESNFSADTNETAGQTDDTMTGEETGDATDADATDATSPDGSTPATQGNSGNNSGNTGGNNSTGGNTETIAPTQGGKQDEELELPDEDAVATAPPIIESPESTDPSQDDSSGGGTSGSTPTDAPDNEFNLTLDDLLNGTP